MDLKHFSSYISCISKETELDGSKTTRRKPHQTFSCGFFISGFRFTVARLEELKSSPVKRSAWSRSVNSFRAATILDGMASSALTTNQERHHGQ